MRIQRPAPAVCSLQEGNLYRLALPNMMLNSLGQSAVDSSMNLYMGLYSVGLGVKLNGVDLDVRLNDVGLDTRLNSR